jgi:putative spermidine/putrescine transport system ATP-binding protein
VVEQNQRTGTAALAELRGKPVHLTWRSEHVIEIPSVKENIDAA